MKARRDHGLVVCIVLSAVLAISFAAAAELPKGFRLEPVTAGLTEPAALASTPDGQILIGERTTGNVRVVDNGLLAASPLCTVPVHSAGEAGLLGIAVHPSFMTNDRVYLYYTDSSTQKNKIAYVEVANGTCSPAVDVVADLGAGANFLRNGGGIGFGPDGKLYVTTGDMEAPVDGQNGAVLQGKILRMNDDGSVPGDNPTPGSLVYALGVRDGRGLAVHPDGQVYATDRGEDPTAEDELNAVAGGGNLGWDDETGPGTLHDSPMVSWAPPVGVGAMAIYTSGVFPDAVGDGIDNDHDRFGADLLPGRGRKDDNGLGECIGSANNGLPCNDDADCSPGRPGEATFRCEKWDDAAEYCPSGTPYYDDGCDTGGHGTDEPDESFVNSLFAASGDTIQRTTPDSPDLDVTSSWTTFFDSSALADCPTDWSAVMEGSDGFLYATARNGGGGGGALYRIVHDVEAGPREVSGPGSYFPLRVDKGATAGDYDIYWEDLRDNSKQPRNTGATSMAPVREFTVWSGTIGSYYSHNPIVGYTSVEGTAINDAVRTTSVTVGDGDSVYFLVSGRGANLEGTLGAGDSGERPGYAVTDLCDSIGYHDPSWALFRCGRSFTLVDEFSVVRSLDEYRGKVVWLDFAGVWCPPCVTQANNMEVQWQAYKDRDVQIITVLMDEDSQGANFDGRPTPAECRNWADRDAPWLDNTFDCWTDPNPVATKQAWPVYDAYNALPTNVVLDTGQRVVYSSGGYNPGAITAVFDAIVGATDTCLH